jgi:hypothetical protein
MMTASHRLAALNLGRPPHNPSGTVMGALASAPSRAWLPGRRGSTDLGPRRPPLFIPKYERKF